MQPGEDRDTALPRRSYEGVYGTIYCSRCEFFGLGYNHPEWCTWQWLKESHQVRHHLDIVEVGERVAELGCDLREERQSEGSTPIPSGEGSER